MPTPFEDLLRQPGQLKQATDAFTRVIRKSFVDHPVRHQTQDEVRRRFAICEKWFRIFRGDKQWTIGRALDSVGAALNAELTGKPYEPSDRQVWLPGDGA